MGYDYADSIASMLVE